MYQSDKRVAERQVALQQQNPIIIKEVKFYTLYGFDTDKDGNIDQIVQNGWFAPGPRSGISASLYMEFTEGEELFEKMKNVLTMQVK